jgi:hypothetical protein
MRFVTLDTGYKGAMVLFDIVEPLGEIQPIEAFEFKKLGVGINIHEIKDKLQLWNPETIYIEIFPPQPYQGVKQTSSQWRVIGQLETLCQLCCWVEYIYVATWTAFTKRLSTSPSANKQISQELVDRYFMDFAKPYKKRKLYHDGIADCLAMGLYVLRDNYLDDLLD